MEGSKGVVDGLKADADGRLFVACPAGLCVLSPKGALLGTPAVAEPATDVAWGGPDHSTLCVTATTSVYAIPTLTMGVGSGLK